MPRLWSETIQTHRSAVRDATLDAAADVVRRRGLASATMSEIAETAGIGRATLYKYFPDVESLIIAWHDRQVAKHLTDLERARDAADPNRRLEVVLETFASHQRDQARSPLAPIVHPSARTDHGPRDRQPGTRTVSMAQAHLADLVAELIEERAKAGLVRDDVPAAELANFCLHALTGAESLTSAAAIRRLCGLVLAGLSPAAGPDDIS